MTIVFSPTIYDTERSKKLAVQLNTLDGQRRIVTQAIDQKIAAVTQQYTDELLAQRPQYPTQQHRELIAELAEHIHADDGPVADRFFTGPVHYDPYSGRLNVYAKAPYKVTTVDRMWEFTPEEVTALRSLLAELKLAITNEWQHDDGWAFVVQSALV